MSFGYKFVLQSDAFRLVMNRRAAERDRLDDFFISLAADPYRKGDFQEVDADGRKVEVVSQGKFLVTYWADHAVKEVRITRIESIKLRRNS